MDHILRAHQLCMEGFQVLFDEQLSTVWSAPNYCYRCGNLASILEVGVQGERHFNVFEAAPENDRPIAADSQRSVFSNGGPTGLYSNGVATSAVSNGAGGNGNGGNYINSTAGPDPTQVKWVITIIIAVVVVVVVVIVAFTLLRTQSVDIRLTSRFWHIVGCHPLLFVMCHSLFPTDTDECHNINIDGHRLLFITLGHSRDHFCSPRRVTTDHTCYLGSWKIEACS